MQELSLNILDIAENSVKAGAALVTVGVCYRPAQDRLTVTIAADGCGRAGAASTSGVCRGAASGAGTWVFFSSIVTPPLRSRLPGSSAPPPGTFPAPPRKRAGR